MFRNAWGAGGYRHRGAWGVDQVQPAAHRHEYGRPQQPRHEHHYPHNNDVFAYNGNVGYGRFLNNPRSDYERAHQRRIYQRGRELGKEQNQRRIDYLYSAALNDGARYEDGRALSYEDVFTPSPTASFTSKTSDTTHATWRRYDLSSLSSSYPSGTESTVSQTVSTSLDTTDASEREEVLRKLKQRRRYFAKEGGLRSSEESATSESSESVALNESSSTSRVGLTHFILCNGVLTSSPLDVETCRQAAR